MATPNRVLDLTTDHDRLTVRIDGADYPLRTANDLTLDAYKTLERIGPQIGALLRLDALTPEQGQELSQLLDQACRLAIVAPDPVQDRLSDVNRVQIFRVFTQLLAPTLVQAARAIDLARHPVAGMKPFRASSGSTAGRPKAGSPRPRSASSARA